MSGFPTVKRTWNYNELPKCWVTSGNPSLLPAQGLLDALTLISHRRKHRTQVGRSLKLALEVCPRSPRLTPRVFCDLQRGDGGSSSRPLPHPTTCLLADVTTQPRDPLYKLWDHASPMEPLLFYFSALRQLPANPATSSDLSFRMRKEGIKIPAPLGPWEDEMK